MFKKHKKLTDTKILSGSLFTKIKYRMCVNKRINFSSSKLACSELQNAARVKTQGLAHVAMQLYTE